MKSILKIIVVMWLMLCFSGCSYREAAGLVSTVAGGVLGNELGDGKSEYVALGSIAGYAGSKAYEKAYEKGYEQGVHEATLRVKGEQAKSEFFKNQEEAGNSNYHRVSYYNLTIDEGYENAVTGTKLDRTVVSVGIVE